MSSPVFHYRHKSLCVEDVFLSDLAQWVGTPFYVYSAGKIGSQYLQYEGAFREVPHTICFAMKSNENLAVCRLLASLGAGADIVSLGELYRAHQAGIPMSKIVFSGVGKTEEEIAAALKAGILMFNVESSEELDVIHAVAQRLRRVAPVSLRVNPNVSVDTHRHITTGHAENKFGIPLSQAEKLFMHASRSSWLKIMGVQVHIGSQILDLSPFRETVRKLQGLIERLEEKGIFLHVVDIGGGLGVPYQGQSPVHPSELARIVAPLMKKNVRLVFEPGRFLVAESGALVSKVLYRKETGRKKFVIVDAGMNDLLRPALYEAHHPILPVHQSAALPSEKADVVGPVCESGDTFARSRLIPHVKRGDLVAFLMSGAYGFSMSSQYNARPRAAEVLVKGHEWWVVRARETLRDLVRGEKVPPYLSVKKKGR
ncbi:MAG TPA: diaminopimelate decarboxylase [Elusimicrobiota bacterium]|nr:diaminopimelate decarboxylase [Elusimicrobiota bacterium]